MSRSSSPLAALLVAVLVLAGFVVFFVSFLLAPFLLLAGFFVVMMMMDRSRSTRAPRLRRSEKLAQQPAPRESEASAPPALRTGAHRTRGDDQAPARRPGE